MARKTCTVCSKAFEDHPSGRKTCSKECMQVQKSRSLSAERRKSTPTGTLVGSGVLRSGKSTEVVDIADLPDVERLPATYLKRAYDLWSELISNSYRKRID
jgi:predicted nucleic acid-binding Zn ribbon protein